MHNGAVVVRRLQVVAFPLLKVVGVNWTGRTTTANKQTNKKRETASVFSGEELANFSRVALTLVHVVPVDLDVLVAVQARVLVVEAEGVQQLVHDDTMFEAAGYPEGHALPLARVAHQGGAAA